MSEKIYVGNGKEQTVERKSGGSFTVLKLSFSKKDLQVMLANVNEKGYINTDVLKRKEPNQWGQTHYLVIDDWKPEKKAEEKANESAKASGYVETPKDDGDLPF